MQLRVADLQRDGHMLEAVKQCANRILLQHPENVDALIDRWLGNSDQYAQV
jgi:ATP-dependent DNA helicase RecG